MSIVNINDVGSGVYGGVASSLGCRNLGLVSRKPAISKIDSVTCSDMTVQTRHLYQTRAKDRCGDYEVHRKGDACLGRYYCYRLWFVSSCTRGRSRISRANRCFLQAAVLLNAVKRRGIASKKNGCGESCIMEWVDTVDLVIIGRGWGGAGQGCCWNCGQKGRSREAQSGYFHHSSR
jgi:hypothetical protein